MKEAPPDLARGRQAPPTEKLQKIPIKDLGDRYQVYRFEHPKLEMELKDSLNRYGQLAPLVVCREGSQYQVLDGLKRLRACQQLAQFEVLQAKVIQAEEGQGKAAMLRLNQERKGLCMVEEGLLIRAMCREEGLPQQTVAGLVNHHPSWVCRRLALSERLHEDVVAHMKLGLIPGSLGRELEKLPCGKQTIALEPIEEHRLNCRETGQLVAMLLIEENVTAETAAACAQNLVRARTKGQAEVGQSGPKRPLSLVALLVGLQRHCLDLLAWREDGNLAGPLQSSAVQVQVAAARDAAQRVVVLLQQGDPMS